MTAHDHRLYRVRFNGKLCYTGVYHHGDNDGRTLAVSVALLTVLGVPGSLYYKESTFGVCQKHLDEWLDHADDNPKFEPTRMTWLNDLSVKKTKRRTQSTDS